MIFKYIFVIMYSMKINIERFKMISDIQKISEALIDIRNSQIKGIPMLSDDDIIILENKLLKLDPDNVYFKIHKLTTKLLKYRHNYYSSTGDQISDDEFDSDESMLRELDPDSTYFDIVGSVDDVGYTEVKHNFPMLSIDSVKYPKTPDIWLRRVDAKKDNGTVLISLPKVDGISGSMVYKNTKFSHGATRGDGITGKIIPFAKDLVVCHEIPFTGIVDIRGEIYIPKKYGETVFKDLPLRNQAAGIIKSCQNTEYLSFIAYQMLFVDIENIFTNESDILDSLTKLGFNTTPYEIITNTNDIKKVMNSYISNKRDGYDYETDGLVLVVNNKCLQKVIDNTRVVRSFHHYNLALKPPSKIVCSKLLDIEINVSKSGRLIPVMIYEPVMIDNVEFERVTINNYKFMETLGKAYVGNTVHIMRGNEILPVIVRMDEDGNKNLPIILPKSECPSCGNSLSDEGKHKVCTNLKCPGRNISLIFNWVVKRNMKNVGIKFLELAYEKGIVTSIIDLYDKNLKFKIEELPGFVRDGGKVIKIMNAIEKSKMNVSDIDILSAIGIPNIGRNVLENINVINIDTLPSDIVGVDNYKISNSQIVVNENYTIPTLAVYRYILEWLVIPGNYADLIKLKKILNSKSDDENKNGKTVCITGSFDVSRSNIVNALEKRGYKSVDSVTKRTDYLLIGDGYEINGKYNKAKRYGVTIVHINDLL